MQPTVKSSPAAGLVGLLVIEFVVMFCSAAGPDDRQPSALLFPRQTTFTDKLREHNALYMAASLEKDAEDKLGLPGGELSHMLAKEINSLEEQSPLGAMFGKVGDLVERQHANKQESASLYSKLRATLGAAKIMAEIARHKLNDLLGFDGGHAFHHWWKENAATPLKDLTAKIFDERPPPAKDIKPEEMQALLAALQRHEYPMSRAGLPLPSGGVQEKVLSGAAPFIGRERSDKWTQTQESQNEEYAQHSVGASRGAQVRAPPVQTDATEIASRERHARQARPLDWQRLAQVTREEEDLEESVTREKQLPGFAQSNEDLIYRPFNDLISKIADSVRFVRSAHQHTLDVQEPRATAEMSRLFSFELAKIYFPPLSLLTETSTRNHWRTLKNIYQQQGKVDVTSVEAQDVMGKVAVVIACAYKISESFFGKEGLRNFMRERAAFRKQVSSALRRDQVGDKGSDEEAFLINEVFQLPEDPLASEREPDAHTRPYLLRYLFAMIIQQPSGFFHRLGHDFNDFLAQWDVEPAKLQSTVKEVISLYSLGTNNAQETEASWLAKRAGRSQLDGKNLAAVLPHDI